SGSVACIAWSTRRSPASRSAPAPAEVRLVPAMTGPVLPARLGTPESATVQWLDRRYTGAGGPRAPAADLAGRSYGWAVPCWLAAADMRGQASRGADLSIPNLITLGRILLVPVVIWAITAGEMRVAFVLFLAAGISDAVDGFLAKRFGMATELGAYLD